MGTGKNTRRCNGKEDSPYPCRLPVFSEDQWRLSLPGLPPPSSSLRVRDSPQRPTTETPLISGLLLFWNQRDIDWDTVYPARICRISLTVILSVNLCAELTGADASGPFPARTHRALDHSPKRGRPLMPLLWSAYSRLTLYLIKNCSTITGR